MKHLLLTFLAGMVSFFVSAQETIKPVPLKTGYSVKLSEITPGKMKYAKSVGIDYIEVSGLNGLFGGDRNLLFSKEKVFEQFKNVKKAADDAGIEIWSVHMPFGRHIDLSLPDERERKEVVALHKQVLEFCRVFQPAVILFHPSYYLGLNEREIRKKQLIQSVLDLNPAVKSLDAVMVIENMLGYRLKKDEKRENPLCRSVSETVEIMDRLPQSVYSAIDMNHIKNPENLIRVMGKRLKSVHIADGDGEKECHYFPCSGEGKNNWTEILTALEEAEYNGPFMFECAYEDEKNLVECYRHLYKKTFTEIEWNETRIRDGIILKSANVELFESQQAVYFVEIDTSIAGLNYFVGMPDTLLPTSTQAKSKGALIAINGSYFNMKEGPSRHFVKIENEVVAETAESEFGTRATGVFSVRSNRIDIAEWTTEKEAASAGDASFALVSGPIVIDDHNTMEMWDSPFVNNRHPRSFAAFCNGKLLLGVVDGRDPGRADGMNLHELRTLAWRLGCSDLLNLDGGGSSTLYVKGISDTGIVNIPSDGNERPVKSIIYVTLNKNE